MESCCNPGVVLARQRHALSVVLVINLAMFLIGLGAGLRARSSALLADSADMLGDAFVYGFSLYISSGARSGRLAGRSSRGR